MHPYDLVVGEKYVLVTIPGMAVHAFSEDRTTAISLKGPAITLEFVSSAQIEAGWLLFKVIDGEHAKKTISYPYWACLWLSVKSP